MPLASVERSFEEVAERFKSLLNTVMPEKVLLSVRRVEEAAVSVKVPPAVIAWVLMVARVPER